MRKYLILSLTAFSLSSMSGFALEEKNATTEAVAVPGDVSEFLIQSRAHVAKLAHDDPVVLEKFDLFAASLIQAHSKEKNMTPWDVQQIFKAVRFAADKHRFQTRKNKEKTPYISHPIGVAHHLMEVGKIRDPSVIIGALLHDTLEDTQTTEDEITQNFGSVVTGYVKELTEDKSLSQEERKRMQVASASHKSIGAAQIKMADNLYNVMDLLTHPPADWSQGRIDRYFEWTQSVVDRLPESNSALRNAVEDVINTYWENQAKKGK